MTPATRTPVDGAPAGYRDWMLSGPQEAVARLIRSRSQAGDLVAMSSPRPYHGGVAVRVRLRTQQAPKQSYPRDVPAPKPRPGLKVAAVIAAVTVAAAAVVAVIVMVVRGVVAAGSWVASSPGVGLAVLGVVGVVGRILTRRSRRDRD